MDSIPKIWFNILLVLSYLFPCCNNLQKTQELLIRKAVQEASWSGLRIWIESTRMDPNAKTGSGKDRMTHGAKKSKAFFYSNCSVNTICYYPVLSTE